MVSWSADGTLSGYDSVTRAHKYNTFFFASTGSVNLNGATRLGAALDASFSSASYPNRLYATAPITFVADDWLLIGPTKQLSVNMYVVADSAFAAGAVPTPVAIFYAARSSGTVTRATTAHTTPGTRTYTISSGPRLAQGVRYWVALLPVYRGSSALNDNIVPSSDPDNMGGRALSVWGNRTPAAPTITSPATSSVIAPGASFTLTYSTADPDGLGTDDAQRVNRDLAGVEFQYAPQATPENPNPEWLPFPWRPKSGGPDNRSWDIRGTVDDLNYIDITEWAYLRESLGGSVVCGYDPYSTDFGGLGGAVTVYGKGVLPSGDWQIRCRTFDFGHPYPLAARPVQGTPYPVASPFDGYPVGGLTPSTFPATNTSPWSAAIKVSIPVQVPAPVPLSPINEVAVPFDTTTRLLWQYRNTFVPPYEQASREVRIRRVGDPLWTTVFRGASDLPYVDLEPNHPAEPVTTHQYLTDLTFEANTLGGWTTRSNPDFPPCSPAPAVANQNTGGQAHAGSRYLRFTAGPGGYALAENQFALRPEDQTFEFQCWIAPPDTLDSVYFYVIWVNEDGEDLAEAEPGDNMLGHVQQDGFGWGGYVNFQGSTERAPGAASARIMIWLSSSDLYSGISVDTRLDDVSFIGTSVGTEAFDLEVSTRYEWAVRATDASGESSDFSPSARFWVVPTPASGEERPLTSENIDGATLGCGTHRVEIFRRGGLERVGEIKNVSYVDWERKRDDVSSARVDVSDWGIDCGNLLASLQTWAYEIVLWRDNGFTEDRVWEGPITLLTYEADKVTIHAKDVMGYTLRRIIKQGLSDAATGATVVDRARRIIQNVFAPDDPNVLSYLRVITNEDDAMQYRSVPAYSRTAHEEIDDMAANAGLDYTAVGRAILIWGTKSRIGTLPEFKDKDLGAIPIVSEYGMNMANRYVVSDGNGVWGEATRGLDPVSGNDETYGLVEMLSSTWASDSEADTGTYTQAGLQTVVQSFEEFSERSIADRYGPPVVVRVPDNTTLNPGAVVSIQHLVPGVVIPLRSSGTLRTVVGNQKLDSLKVVEQGGKETISVTLSAFNREDTSTEMTEEA